MFVQNLMNYNNQFKYNGITYSFKAKEIKEISVNIDVDKKFPGYFKEVFPIKKPEEIKVPVSDTKKVEFIKEIKTFEDINKKIEPIILNKKVGRPKKKEVINAN